jgi:hypothetical protein
MWFWKVTPSSFTSLMRASEKTLPIHEAMQSPARANHVEPGTQIKVVRVSEQDLDTGPREILGGQRLHRTQGADRHEARRADLPTRERQTPRTRPAVGPIQGEGADEGRAHTTTIASPYE